MKIKLKQNLVKSIFILEDNEDRINWFKQIFSFVPTLFITKKIDIALMALNLHKYDILFLDHDLYENYDPTLYTGEPLALELTGLYVAQKLRDTINKDTLCIIHSMNPTGSTNMIHAHPFNTVHIPYHILRDSLEIEELNELS
jgi:hypothetical protein